jgi:hypothetical protein
MIFTMLDDDRVARRDNVVDTHHMGQVQPRPGERGEPDAVEHYDFTRFERELVPNDIPPPRFPFIA